MTARYTRLYVDLVTAIAEGDTSVPALRTRLPQHSAETLRNALHLLRGRKLIKSVRKAQAGRPALYALLVPLDAAIETLSPRENGGWSPDALTAAWPAPVLAPALAPVHAPPQLPAAPCDGRRSRARPHSSTVSGGAA